MEFRDHIGYQHHVKPIVAPETLNWDLYNGNAQRGDKLHYVYEYFYPKIFGCPYSLKCFYVGKGVGDRYKGMRSRSTKFRNVIRWIAKQGCKPLIRLSFARLTPFEAEKLERERIHFFLCRGDPLVNRQHNFTIA